MQKQPAISTRQTSTDTKSYFQRPGRAAKKSTSHPSSTSATAGAIFRVSCTSKPGTKKYSRKSVPAAMRQTPSVRVPTRRRGFSVGLRSGGGTLPG